MLILFALVFEFALVFPPVLALALLCCGGSFTIGGWSLLAIAIALAEDWAEVNAANSDKLLLLLDAPAPAPVPAALAAVILFLGWFIWFIWFILFIVLFI